MPNSIRFFNNLEILLNKNIGIAKSIVYAIFYIALGNILYYKIITIIYGDDIYHDTKCLVFCKSILWKLH